jgi:hypothetical protein
MTVKLKARGRPRWTPNRLHPLSPHAKKKRKREEAQARATERAGRTDAEQLAIIASRPGESKRERNRLLKRRAA